MIDESQNTPWSTRQTELWMFLVIVGFHRRITSCLGGISAPLHEMTSSNTTFYRSQELEKIFEKPSNALTSPPASVCSSF